MQHDLLHEAPGTQQRHPVSMANVLEARETLSHN
jgi:hypothetical protein